MATNDCLWTQVFMKHRIVECRIEVPNWLLRYFEKVWEKLNELVNFRILTNWWYRIGAFGMNCCLKNNVETLWSLICICKGMKIPNWWIRYTLYLRMHKGMTNTELNYSNAELTNFHNTELVDADTELMNSVWSNFNKSPLWIAITEWKHLENFETF